MCCFRGGIKSCVSFNHSETNIKGVMVMVMVESILDSIETIVDGIIETTDWYSAWYFVSFVFFCTILFTK